MMIILSAVVFLIALGVYCILPVAVQAIVLLVNFFLPDPIPILDEAIMCLVLANKVMRG